MEQFDRQMIAAIDRDYAFREWTDKLRAISARRRKRDNQRDE